jgi:hypothetical protein
MYVCLRYHKVAEPLQCKRLTAGAKNRAETSVQNKLQLLPAPMASKGQPAAGLHGLPTPWHNAPDPSRGQTHKLPTSLGLKGWQNREKTGSR